MTTGTKVVSVWLHLRCNDWNAAVVSALGLRPWLGNCSNGDCSCLMALTDNRVSSYGFMLSIAV